MKQDIVTAAMQLFIGVEVTMIIFYIFGAMIVFKEMSKDKSEPMYLKIATAIFWLPVVVYIYVMDD